MPTPRYYQIDDIRSRFQTVATSNNYQAFFELNGPVMNAAVSRGLNYQFLTEDLGLYVSDAVIPGSSFADVEVSGDRQGITERFPHTRIFDDVTFTFYVDRDYNVMKFFEVWSEFINPLKRASTGQNANVMRLRYPGFYKCRMSIYKFNKDAFTDPRGGAIAYTFINAWPYSIASTPVSYNGSTLLQLNVTFRYDRYTTHNITIAEEPETIIRQQQLWEQNLLDATGGGIALTGAGTLQELYEINNQGGTYGGPLRDVPAPNPRGEDVVTPSAFKGNFGFGPGAA
jgi:hypothetical protein